MSLSDLLVLIKGAGDLASGVAYRLHRAGFSVVMTELPQPMAVRRAVAFAEAVYAGETAVEGVVARRAADPDEALALVRHGAIPVLVDPEARAARVLSPAVLVDAVMAKRNTGTRLSDAQLVIALGPGFTAGADCHVVIETHRGHTLGRTMWQGRALPNTGTPGEIAGHGEARVLRAPRAGTVRAARAIGDLVEPGKIVAWVDGEPVRTQIAGVIRGLIREGLVVKAGMKLGDVDPRAQREQCFTISEKALAVAGGVLEAILSAPWVKAGPSFRNP